MSVYIVSLWRIADDYPRTAALYMVAPFALAGLIAIGRGLDGAELLFRVTFMVAVYKLTEYLLSRTPASRIIDIS